MGWQNDGTKKQNSYFETYDKVRFCVSADKEDTGSAGLEREGDKVYDGGGLSSSVSKLAAKHVQLHLQEALVMQTLHVLALLSDAFQ